MWVDRERKQRQFPKVLPSFPCWVELQQTQTFWGSCIFLEGSKIHITRFDTRIVPVPWKQHLCG